MDSSSGLGDVTFELAYMAERQRDLQIAYAVGYKASTGQSRATGTGVARLIYMRLLGLAARIEVTCHFTGMDNWVLRLWVTAH